MKLTLLCLLSCLLLLLSCSDKASDEPVPSLPCQLSEVRNKGGEEIWQQLTYDTEGRPVSYFFNDSRMYAQFRISLTYDAAGRRKEMESELLQNGWRGKTVYTYNDAGKTDTVYLYDYEYGSDNFAAVYVHTYNQQNQLSEIRAKVLKDSQLQDRLVFLYFYEGNQLSRREDYEVGNANFRAVYHLKFDNKKRPDQIGILPQVAGLDHYGYLCDFLLPNQHNLTSFRFVSATTGETYQMLSFTSSYTYNKQGYPVNQKTTYLDGKEKVFTFSYNCQ